MVFTTLAWRMAYHNFLLLKIFEVNLTPSPRTQKSPALGKSHGSSPLWSVPGRKTPNTHPDTSQTSMTSGHGHCHTTTDLPGLWASAAPHPLSSSLTSPLNYGPSFGCDCQTPFWTMFMCNEDRKIWQWLMCMVTHKGWCELQQVHVTWFTL